MVRLLPYPVVNAYILILFFLSNLLFPFALQKTHFLLSSQVTEHAAKHSPVPAMLWQPLRKEGYTSLCLPHWQWEARSVSLSNTHIVQNITELVLFWIDLLSSSLVLNNSLGSTAKGCHSESSNFLLPASEFISTAICKLYKLGSITRSFQKKISFCWWLLFQSTKVSF